MDRHAAWLDRRVAEAANAWLIDPQDAAVYGRLVAAILRRRAYLEPELEPATDDQPVDDHDELPGIEAGMRLGDVLGGQDPTQVLAQLRRASDS